MHSDSTKLGFCLLSMHTTQKNVDAVLETIYKGTPSVYSATIPNDEYPVGYPSTLEQRKNYTRMASAIDTTIFFDPQVLDKYNFPGISFAVSADGQLALTLEDDDPETLPPVEFDPDKAKSLWLDHAEDITDIVFARRTQSGHIVLRELGSLPTRVWLNPEDYLRGNHHLITNFEGEYQFGSIYGTIDDAWRSPTLQEIIDETDWDPTLFSPGW